MAAALEEVAFFVNNTQASTAHEHRNCRRFDPPHISEASLASCELVLEMAALLFCLGTKRGFVFSRFCIMISGLDLAVRFLLKPSSLHETPFFV